jgi:hypothetical protein
MRSRTIFFLIMIMLAATAFSQSPPQPYSVKADRLGETLAEWGANNPRFDKCPDYTIDDRYGSVSPKLVDCLTRSWKDGQDFTYATSPVLLETAWFYRDNLYKVEITLLSQAGLPDVISRLKRKFGKPVGRETTRTQNGFGVRSERKELTWTNTASTLLLSYSTAYDERPRLTFTFNTLNKDLPHRAEQAERASAHSDM